jgi:murein DD-endopeptidase MepM/ murein hydrolase activator NlpD
MYPSVKERFWGIVKHLSLGTFIGGGVFLFFIHTFSSPMESLLQKENKLLKTQYDVLSVQLDDALNVLNDIQQRDEKLYRAIFQARTIPESVRKSGFGGTNRYEYLTDISNSNLVVETTMKMDILKKQLYVQSNSLEELITVGKNLEDRSRCVPAIQPIPNKDLKRTASGYGMRIDPIYRTLRFHSGMDFSAPVGTEIYATGDGQVILSGLKQGYGNCIIVDHGYGFKTLYAHQSKNLVRAGQKVTRGEVIGLVGSTGKSTGPHLHYEVLLHNKPDNPAKYYFKDLSPEEYDQMIQIAENHGQVMDFR